MSRRPDCCFGLSTVISGDLLYVIFENNGFNHLSGCKRVTLGECAIMAYNRMRNTNIEGNPEDIFEFVGFDHERNSLTVRVR